MDQPGVLPSSEDKPAYVNDMFARIAPTYDVMNRLMTLGQDQRWRRRLLEQCNLPTSGSLLDVGSGTGDIAYEAIRLNPGIRAIGADFTYEMMAAGVDKVPGLCVPFVQADALVLPFPAATFDAVVSGFLIRNVVDRVAAFREMARVTRPGGRVVCLETTPPGSGLVGRMGEFYFKTIVPALGKLISGDNQAYTYLPQSTVAFLQPEELRRSMELAGLSNVSYELLMMRSVAIHVGTRQ
jgi:demethylmenaquinone methyltransferase/2-methoxy-6-polyprenyl-1,4-benzoquinol methylase